MLSSIADFIARWRTWLVNTVAAFIIFLPDLIYALLGFNWGDIVSPSAMPYVTLVILVLNVWMRPRAAVLPKDFEDD